MKKRLLILVTLIILVFTGMERSSAQTHVITHNVDWVTHDQNMWGPNGSPFTINMDVDLFDIYFDTLVSVNFIQNIFGGQFGAALDIDTWLDLGSTFSLHGFTTGSVDATYPVKIDLTFPNNFTFNPGQNITINTDYSVRPGWDLTTYFPSAGVAQLDLFFGFGLDIDATVCLWNCWTFTPISINVPTDSINIFYLNSQTGAFSYPCWTGSSFGICHDTILPIYFSIPGIGLTGWIDIPYVVTTDHLGADKCLYANGEDPWLNIDIDVIQFLSAIASLIPPPAGPAIQQFLSLLSGTINIGAGITIDYTLLAINIGMTSYMQQDFTLCPTVWTTFTMPTNVDYTVTCPDTNNIQVAAGNAQVITVRTGNDLHFDYPCFGYPTWDMGFRHHLTNDFTNHTWDSLAFYFSVTALEFWINIPSFPVMPDLCIPANCLTVPVTCPEKSGNPDSCWQTICTPQICTPAVVLQPADWVIHIGPLFQQTWPLGYIPITWYNNTWQLAGWSPDMSGIYDTVMPNHTIIPNPPMAISTSMVSPIICFGDSTGAFTVTVTNGTPAYTYVWSTGDTVTTQATSNTLSNLGAGTYYVTVSDVNGCSLMDTMTIANVDPQLFITLEPTQVTCFGGSDGNIIAHVTGGTPGYVYAWTPIGGTDSIAGSLPAGTYIVNVTDLLGCPISDSTTLIELWPLPEINISSDITEGCQPLQVQFYETTPAAGQIYLWDFHDAGATSTDKNPMHVFEDWGSYPVTIYVTSVHGCTDSLTIDSMINVYPKPVALFYPRPGVTDIVDPYVYFDNQSTFTDFSRWIFGDGEVSDSMSPGHQYLDTGSYSVTLYVMSEHGCRDTTYGEIIVNEVITFYAPNAFSPDNNGMNDVFLVKGSGIDPATFRMMIFDRWGELVFESNDINKGWDGSVKGRIIEQTAVYTWTVSYKDITRRKYRYYGNVTLLR